MIVIQNLETFEALREFDDVAWDLLHQGVQAFKKYLPESETFILELQKTDEGDYFQFDVISNLDEEVIRVQFEQVLKNWWDTIPEDIQADFQIGVSFG